MDLLATLVADRGMAMVLITHDLGLAARYCGAIAVMERGLVVERGATARLFAPPKPPVYQTTDRSFAHPNLDPHRSAPSPILHGRGPNDAQAECGARPHPGPLP